jgi:hypothetical protein
VCLSSIATVRSHVASISRSYVCWCDGVAPVGLSARVEPTGLSRCAGNAYGSVSSASCSSCSPGYFCSAGTCLNWFNTGVCRFEKGRIDRHAMPNIGRRVVMQLSHNHSPDPSFSSVVMIERSGLRSCVEVKGGRGIHLGRCCPARGVSVALLLPGRRQRVGRVAAPVSGGGVL